MEVWLEGFCKQKCLVLFKGTAKQITDECHCSLTLDSSGDKAFLEINTKTILRYENTSGKKEQ